MNDEKTLFPLPPPSPIKIEKKFKDRNPIWTECKAKLIERYLYYFVQITHSRTYIDAFAGPQETDKPEMWSAKLVIESYPRWLRKFYLFEINPASINLLMYYMIHASDHDEASVLMNRAYGKALEMKESLDQMDFLRNAFPP